MKEETWSVFLCGQAKRANKALSKVAQNAFALLLSDLRFGPEVPSWPHYSKLGRSSYHCHLKRGRPTYVACWRVEKKTKIIEVYYAGTHEKAPY